MTDKMKSFLESISGDEAFLEKLKKASTPEEVRALAAEKGVTLSDEDLSRKEAVSELSDDEVEAVSGGKVCVCDSGGGGESSYEGEGTCACVFLGEGDYEVMDIRCFCVIAGGGKN